MQTPPCMQLESRLRRVVPTVQSLPARPPGDTNRGPALEHPPALSEGESLEEGVVRTALACEIVPLCRASVGYGAVFRLAFRGARLVGAHLPRTRARERGPCAVYACPPRRGPKIVRSHPRGGVLVRSPETMAPPCTPGRRRTRRGGRRRARGSRRRAQVHRGCTGGATNEERGGDRTFAGSWRRWRGASPPSRL